MTCRFACTTCRGALSWATRSTSAWAIVAIGFAGAAFRSDGMELAVDTEQGIAVWDLDPTHWVEAACDVAGRNLTRGRMGQFIGDLAPYGSGARSTRARARSAHAGQAMTGFVHTAQFKSGMSIG